MATLIAPTINFLILIGLLTYFLRRPLREFVVARHHAVASDLKTAQGMLREAKIKYDEFSNRLRTMETEIAALKIQSQTDAEEMRQRIIEQANKLSQTILVDAQAGTQTLMAELKGDLYNELGEAVLVRAEQLVRERLSFDDRAKVRQDFVRQVEAAS